MWSLFQRNARQAKSAHRTPSSVRPRLEALEDRCLLNGAGSLDPTFGNGAGYVLTNGGRTPSALIQPNGDIVAAGVSNSGGFLLARYNPNGSLDTSFGSGGVASASFGSGNVTNSVALYPAGTANAGDIVQEGYYTSGNQTYQVLARYNSNGTLDTTFGTNGEVTTAFPGMTELSDGGVIVTSAGQIVAYSDNANGSQFVLARYNANGSLDTTFGQGGYVITNVAGGDPAWGATVHQLPNGDFLVNYTAGPNGSYNDDEGGVWQMYCFTPNGQLDTSFGNQGIVTTTAPGEPEAAVVYPDAGTPNDGQIVLVGQASGGPLELIRYNANGSLDTTFGTGGFMQTQLQFSASNAALDGNGRIDVVGGDSNGNGVARFNVNGTLDTTFGNGGVATPYIDGAAARGIAVYPNAGAATDSDIVITGSEDIDSTRYFFAARYLGEASGPYFQITGPSSVTAGTAGTYTISVFNPDGSPDTGYSGTVHITSSDPKAVLPANFTITGDTATFTATLETAGLQSLTAADTVTSSITGSDASITITPAAASQFILSAPSSVKSGSKFSVTLTVEDAFGNVVTGYVGTVHFTSSDSTASLPANYTFTASDAGVYTFTNAFILKKKGTQTLTVTDTQNSALTASDSINVT
ncbi:MAG TPA: hypothetical protein VMF69_28880 [Gemmataceae bacterium]|nr:hypothetical protein [Gemmataceae bacterium]